MRRRAVLQLGLAFAVAIVAAASARASTDTLYRWVDGRGVIHFTDAPTDGRYKPFVPKLRPRSSFWTGPVVGIRKSKQARLYDELIADIADANGLPPALVKAVIATESNFDPRAVSSKGARGLMQLMPTTADMLGVDDPLAPAENVSGGTRYLRALIDRYGRLGHALAAYNAGPTNVDRYGGIPPFPETREYVARVLAYYRAYHGEFRP
jgi:soluble lytic murein transglycosylase-like protein